MDQPDKNVFSDQTPAQEHERGRDSLFLMALLRLPGIFEPVSVRVRNLSAGGLMAELPEPVATEAAVEVDVRGIGWVAGRIAWQTEGRIGISFDREIDPLLARQPFGATIEKPRFGSRG